MLLPMRVCFIVLRYVVVVVVVVVMVMVMVVFSYNFVSGIFASNLCHLKAM
jgi:hypothetical protein